MKGLLIILLTAGLIFTACASEKPKYTPVSEEEYKPSKPGEVEKFLPGREMTHFSRVEAIGKAYWTRIWILWGDIEKEKGFYDFGHLDFLIRSGQEEGIEFLITILPFAEWDQKGYGEEYKGKIPMPYGWLEIKVGKPSDMDAYSRFLKKLVERYDGDGFEDMPGLLHPVRYWEISNEPGLQTSQLKFFHGTPQDYLELLKVSYRAIKKADPDAKVLMGGMAGMHDVFVRFWEPIMEEAGEYFDIANIHSISTDERREDLFVFKFKKFLKKHKIEKPIWVTEAQLGILGSGWEAGRELGEKEMNKLLVRSAVLSLVLGAEKIFFISDNWKHESTLRVYKTLVEKLNRFHSFEVIDHKFVENEGDDAGITSIYGYYKFMVDNRTICVLWGEGKLSDILEGEVKVTDIYGNEKILDASKVLLTDIPIYVELVSQAIEKGVSLKTLSK